MELGKAFLVVNVYVVYVPCEERILFWEDLLEQNYLIADKLILGVDLNFTIKGVEIWEISARGGSFG
jgi:hypothetical protein